jgi:signal transduction histidine kinase/ligand-binding sensor domain-containing protein/DNA-binding response OmpR family regulator
MKNILLTTILILFPALCYGEFHRIFTTNKELSSSLINNIYQDRNNIIWISTEDGLNRYDGVKFTIYRNNPDDEHSLAHNYVRALFEDKQGHLLVGTYIGLQLYDSAADRFSPLAKYANGEIFNSFITNIIQRKNGEIWVAGNELCRIYIKDGEVTVENMEMPIPNTLIEDIMEDGSGNLWITREEDGVYKVSPNNQVVHYFGHKENPAILLLCEDAQGNIYGGSPQNGLFRYDQQKDQFVPILYKGKQNLPIKSLCPAGPHELFIGTDGYGLKLFDARTQQISDIQIESDLFDSSTSKVHFIRKDTDGNSWLAIYQKGVVMIPAQSNGFKYMGYKSVSRNIIGSNSITSFCQVRNRTLYVGTDNDGIYAITEEGKQKAHYIHTDDAHAVPSIIINLYEDSDQNLWVGSFGNGAAIMNKETGRCAYQTDLKDKSGKSVRNVYAFAEDKHHRVWIATMGGGLFYYDLNTKQICTNQAISERIRTNWICNLHYSSEYNRLYACTYSGLFCVDMSSPELTSHEILLQQIIHCIYEDRAGNIWAGTSEGLSKWNVESGELITYTVADGLPSNSIYAIQGDADNSLWISTNGGISHFNPESLQFANYYVSDGLQGNEFCKNASLRSNKGMIWFGGMNGITYFNPQEIVSSSKKWTTRITDFYLYDQPVRTGMKSGSKTIIDRPVFQSAEFRLAYPDNSFSIEFTTQELNTPERITYQYAMNDDKWVNLPKGVNRVSFANLPSGTYYFSVKAKDYLVESDVQTIAIHIAPPWWATGWAKIIYVLLALGAVALSIQQLRRHYRIKQKMLQHTHTEQINEAKLQFFINIAHEIRTPMSLIISPLQKLMELDSDEMHQKNYRIIRRNSDRILRLVNALMDVRKIDKGLMRLTFRETDMVGFINDLCETFAETAMQQNITFTFSHEGLEELKLWVDPANFDKVLLNILSNAFKFTPNGGWVEISLRINRQFNEKGDSCAEIEVTDSGIGISETELERIFDRFYQIRNDRNSVQIGSGVGLHLTRSFVELHHGRIHAENNLHGKSGSRFIIQLPLGNTHLQAEEMDTQVLSQPLTHATPLAEPTVEESTGNRPRIRTKYRILLVEDDEDIRSYLRQELSPEYHIMESSNGREAMETIHRKAPDLVISDVMMPEQDGFTLCRKLKQHIHLSHIPIILLTAKVREEDNIEGLETGADAYLTKPFSIDLLMKTVENLIHGREQLRNVYSGNQQAPDKLLEKIEALSPDERLMKRIMKSVNAHLADPNLTVEMIASEVGLSRAHLHRKLKELTNQTTRDFLRNVRLKQAATLLADKRHTVSEVAELVGFTNQGNFSSAFKELYGVTPTAYRDHQKAEPASSNPGTSM